MIAGIEFAAGIACLVLGTLGTFLAVSRGTRAVSATFWIAVALDLCVLATLFFDWGYKWVHQVALTTALGTNIWIALPHAGVVMTLLMMVVWGRRTAPWAVVITAAQAVSFIPVIVLVGLDTDTSYLAFAPMFGAFASLLAAFLFLPAAAAVIPAAGSRWYPVVFGPRVHLIRALSSLRDLGFAIAGPTSVFDSGSASGNIGNVRVRVTTTPSILPPAYALRITWSWTWPDKLNAEPVDRPGFAPRETLTGERGTLEYLGLSPRGFKVSEESLQSFLGRVSDD